jgi:Cu+-exporting ATPase
MNIEAEKAFAKRDYQGKTVYFCSDSCRKRFDADPSRFVRRPG